MGFFSNLSVTILELYEDGMAIEDIANKLNVDIVTVAEIVGDYADGNYDDSMDGDFDSAMASAGFGTDEDYGYYGDE